VSAETPVTGRFTRQQAVPLGCGTARRNGHPDPLKPGCRFCDLFTAEAESPDFVLLELRRWPGP
jgi:hypothetical protein